MREANMEHTFNLHARLHDDEAVFESNRSASKQVRPWGIRQKKMWDEGSAFGENVDGELEQQQFTNQYRIDAARSVPMSSGEGRGL